jgi:hypothetical protein
MKKSFALGITLIIVGIVSLVTGCSAVFNTTKLGDAVDKTYDFKDFTAVQISDSFQYDVQQSDSYSITVSTFSNLIDRLDIHQSGDTLYVSMKNTFSFGFFNSENIRIKIAMPRIANLTVSDSCDGSATGFTSNSDLAIGVHSSSRLNMDMTAGKTTMDISGSSNISGNLTAADTTVSVSSSSRLDMRLVAGKTSMTFSGSSRGSGALTAADTTINVNSSSDINIAMKTGNASFTAFGSSYIDGEISALNSDFTFSSSSHGNLQGTAGDVMIIASGSSYANFGGLVIRNADVTLQSSSHATIQTDGTLDIDASGSSHLDYYGNPTVGKLNVTSSSSVNHKSTVYVK